MGPLMDRRRKFSVKCMLLPSVHLRLPGDLLAHVNRAAAAEGITGQDFIRAALRDALARHKRRQAWAGRRDTAA